MTDKTLKAIKDGLVSDRALLGEIKSDKDAAKAIEKMAIGANDMTINRQMALIAVLLGVGSRTRNTPADVGPTYRIFHDKVRAPGTGRQPQKDKTFDTMVSYYNSFSMLGNVKAWDAMDEVFPWVLDNVSGTYSFRGTVLRAIAEEKTQPTVARMEEIIAAATKAPKLDKVATTARNMVDKLGVTFPELKTQDTAARKAYVKLVLAAKAFESACDTGESTGDDAEWQKMLADAA